MESEKVKEIKKALECCVDSIKYGCEGCPYHKSSSDCQELLVWDMEDYINELESENERLQKDCADIANDYQEMGKFYLEETEKNQQLKDRIAELEKEKAEQ